MKYRKTVVFTMGVALAGHCACLSAALVVYDDGQTHHVNGGGTIRVQDSPSGIPTTVYIVGGHIPYGAGCWGNSQINVLGGKIESSLIAHDNSRITVSGGYITNGTRADDASHLLISGGLFHGGITAMDQSDVEITGGRFETDVDMLFAHEQSLITIYGSDFNYPYGAITATSGVLTGTLANGDTIRWSFNRGGIVPGPYYHPGSIILAVPEPTTLLLLGLGAVMVRRKC